MHDHDEVPYIVIERERGGMEPFLWGALLGAGLALLFAPRSGAETQREIRDRVRSLRDTAGGRIDEARDRVTSAVERTRGEVSGRVNAVRDAIETRTSQVRQAVDAGRHAARDARTELERRVAEAKATVEGVRTGVAEEEELPAPAAEVVVTEVIVEETGGEGLR